MKEASKNMHTELINCLDELIKCLDSELPSKLSLDLNVKLYSDLWLEIPTNSRILAELSKRIIL